jgi:hypothetical protein
VARRDGGRGARFLIRLMDAITSTRSAVLAPLALGTAVAAGLVSGSAEVFQVTLALGAAAWAATVLRMAGRRRPGEAEDVLGERERILAEIDARLDEAARRLIARADATVRRGRPFRATVESGYEPAEWERRRAQLRRIYELADAVEREYTGPGRDPTDATALIALPELPRQVEKAVRLARRRVSVLQALYSTTREEIAERLRREEAEARAPGISDQLRAVREGRAAITRRELETYTRLLEERETLDALLDSIESFLRRLSFRSISTDEVQEQITEIDQSLEAHDQAMEALRREMRRGTGAV